MSDVTRGTRGASSSRAPAIEDPRIDGVLGALEEIGNLMGGQARERAAAVAQAAEAVVATANVANGNNYGGGNGNGNRPMSQLVEQFLKPKPARFDGAGDLEMAPRWIEKLEKAFEVLGCTDEEKVTPATYHEAFNEKYFSEIAQERKLVEFQQLRQNQLTIDQHEAELARPLRYAPRMVENPIDKAWRFRDGLRPDLHSRMIAPNPRTYEDMYERGRMIERDMKERAAASGSRFAPVGDNRQAGKRPMAGNRRFIPPVRKNIGKPNHQTNWNCRMCGRRHRNGPRPSRTGACFKCGQWGHQIRNRPSQAPGP
ncbi:uncharacterized protein LOC125312739 [Rhodamnia argentea]|uniref:Uncharacterized protein LOC125312739 n=1 Tax=Rhodamnia argentea TaxID=178133 RepID=A0ABM3GTY7_9MYRT|nr:uncharacterized protein LOC125312739 [Rhodamnia argentea]